RPVPAARGRAFCAAAARKDGRSPAEPPAGDSVERRLRRAGRADVPDRRQCRADHPAIQRLNAPVTIDDLKPGLCHSATITIGEALAVPASGRLLGETADMPPVFATVNMIALSSGPASRRWRPT